MSKNYMPRIMDKELTDRLESIGAVLIVLSFFAANKIIESNKKVRPIAPKIVKTVFIE